MLQLSLCPVWDACRVGMGWNGWLQDRTPCREGREGAAASFPSRQMLQEDLRGVKFLLLPLSSGLEPGGNSERGEQMISVIFSSFFQALPSRLP